MEKMQSLIFPVGLFSFLSFLLITCSAKLNITTDGYALLAFKNKISSDPLGIISKNWSFHPGSDGASVCQWVGVNCGSRRHRRVTGLDVSNMGLSGTIAPELGNLSFLASLDISWNNFAGELPNELSHLRRLKKLHFSDNFLSGEIPSWIDSLHELQQLYLSNNSFVGIIPTSITNLSKLESLYLSNNSLQGSIPRGIDSIYNLKRLVIENSNISGTIPDELFNISTLELIALKDNSLSGSLAMSICNRLKKLWLLNLTKNKLNGQIPATMSNCSELQILSLSYNSFGGNIPKELGNLEALEQLYLGYNNFVEGDIPADVGHLDHLKVLSIPGSNLIGFIPVEIFNISSLSLINLPFNHLFGNLPSNMCDGHSNLQYLYLGINSLAGVLPKSLSNCSNIQVLDLDGNEFVGSIPEFLGNLRLLEVLDLNGNNFTTNPDSLDLNFLNSLSNCKYLRFLDISYNPLNAYITESIGNLSTSIEEIYASDSGIKGRIPTEFGNLSGLILLDLHNNQMIGSMPETFDGLQKLQVLNLSNNELQMVKLENLCGLPKLDSLYLSGNNILGSIPDCLGSVTSLRYLHLDSNRLTSIIPSKLFNLKYLLELNISRNFLSGILPSEIGLLKVIVQLDISFNNLSGYVPSTVGSLQNVEYLSLAFNSFQGPIPESLSNLIALETLVLSHNNLSGIIPMTLEKLQYLKYFNVSYNDLSGEIPSNGPFQNFSSTSFNFNKALCGAQKFNVLPCQKTSTFKTRGHKIHKVLFILLSFAAVIGVLGFISIYHLNLRKGKILLPRMLDFILLTSHERFSYYRIARATNKFNETNLLGKGGFGSVYRATIDGGRTFAIKVFNPEIQGAFMSFEKECEVLRNLRHRNLTKVISSCSTPDFKALILELMPNGSLEKWLYSHNYFLNIKQRLNIMIDTAVALEYLHNGCLTPVVHCDLKPSNILLDGDMVAHISDFGISKFLLRDDSVIYTHTIATFGYIAPEYGSEGLISSKCDVYSYGIILMEVFTRVKPTDEMFSENFNMRHWMSNSMANGLADMLDANLFNANGVNYNQKLEALHSIIEMALKCTVESPRERCGIKEVITVLQKIKHQLHESTP